MGAPLSIEAGPAHALLAPSSAGRWVACAGSVTLAALYPEEETQEAREGTAAHWGAFELLYWRQIDVGLVAPNGVTLTEEMVEAAELYVSHIDDTLTRYGLARDSLHVEERVTIPDVHPLNWGTPDCWFYAPAQGVLVVFDFKFGHRFIEVFENWQLIDYTSGILSRLGVDGIADQSLRVELYITQPRSYHKDGAIRLWTITAAGLRGHFNKLRNAAEASQMPGAMCTPNPECEFCPGRHACEALQRSGYKAAEMAGQSIPVELPPSALGLELRTLQRARGLLDARITGLEEQTLSSIRRGVLVPGYAAEQTEGRETWNKPAAEVVALGDLFGVKVAKPAVLTPAQARKAGLPAEVVASYCDRPQRGIKLVVDDGTQARKIFGAQ